MLHRPRLLFLEDDETITYAISRVLAPSYEVDTCNNVDDALALCSQTLYTVLLVDIVLRQARSGFDFIRSVRELPGYNQTPIVVHTALSHGSAQAECFACGATAFLLRPTANADLLATLADQLSIA